MCSNVEKILGAATHRQSREVDAVRRGCHVAVLGCAVREVGEARRLRSRARCDDRILYYKKKKSTI